MDTVSNLQNPIYLSGLPFGPGGGLGGLQQPGVGGPGTGGGGSPFGMQAGPGLDLLSLLSQMNGQDAGEGNFSSLLAAIGQGGLGSQQLGQNVNQGFGIAGQMGPMPSQAGGQTAGSTAGTSVDPASLMQRLLGLGLAGGKFAGQLAQGQSSQSGGSEATGGQTGLASPTMPAEVNAAPDGSRGSVPTADPSFDPFAGGTPTVPFPGMIDQAPAGSRGSIPTADPNFDPTSGSSSGTSGAGLVGGGLSAAGAGLGLAGSLSGNQDLGMAGRATGAAGSVVSAGDTLASGGSIGGGVSGALSGVARLGTGAMDIANAPSDRQKAAQALQTLGMAVSDFYTGGLSELGPLLGGVIGQDNPIGAMLTGFPALMNPGVDVSRYTQLRDAANARGTNAVVAQQNLASRVPANDLGAAWAALAAPGGPVRSYFTPPAEEAGRLGLTPGEGWNQMTPQQFGGAMDWLSQDPARLSSITGTGEIPYLPQGDAQRYADQSAFSAQALIARALGLPFSGPSATLNPDVSPDQAQAFAAGEQSFLDQRNQWSAAHPGVTLAPYTPTYVNYLQQLQNAPPPSIDWGFNNNTL